MKIYLDTCILSRLLDMRVKERQLDALEFIATYEPAKLVTSPKTLEEFSNVINPQRRKSLIVLFKIIEKVYAVPPIRPYSPLFGDMPFGVPFGESGELIEPPYDKLRTLFDDNDASHIYFAYKSECDFLLTLDQTTIVDVAKKNEDELKKMIQPKGYSKKPKKFIPKYRRKS